MFDIEEFISVIQTNQCIWNKQLKLKWKNIRDTFRKKCIKKSGQATKNEKQYVYANILQFLRPTMENRRTESNVIESEPEEETKVQSEVKNVDDPDISVGDSEVETQKSQIPKSFKKPKISFEDNLLKLLERGKVEDPVSSFLMSLAPQIRLLNQEKQNKIFIEFLQVIQKVSSESPSQNTHIPPAINNVNSWSIQHPTSTLYDRSYDAYSTAINQRPHHLNITPPSSSLTSSGLDAYQSVSTAARPQYYIPNSSQTVTAPVSPSTTLFNYSSLNTDEYENSK